MGMKQDIRVLRDFLNMPLDNADGIFKKFSNIKGSVMRGDGKSRFLYIEGSRPKDNRLVLVAHTDTVFKNTRVPDVTLKRGKIWRKGGVGLGADDRAGVAILWLLRNSGHSILLLDGEECGGLGASFLMTANNKDIADRVNGDHCFMIEFDRRGDQNFVTYRVGGDEFEKYMEKETGYKCGFGSFSDISVICDKICGANFSVGYHMEHFSMEHLIVSQWFRTLTIFRDFVRKETFQKFVKPITPFYYDRTYPIRYGGGYYESNSLWEKWYGKNDKKYPVIEVEDDESGFEYEMDDGIVTVRDPSYSYLNGNAPLKGKKKRNRRARQNSYNYEDWEKFENGGK